MSGKTLGILGLLTLILVGLAAALSSRHPPAIQGANQPLFPDFEKNINRAAGISISTSATAVHVIRKDNQWQVREKHGYPAATSQVRQILFGIGELTRLEPKTKNPSLYSEINVEDITNKGSKAKLIEVTDDQGKTMAKVLVGKEQPDKADPSAKEYFVRIPGAAQSWLVSGNLIADATTKGWLDSQLLDIEKNRIEKVIVNQGSGDIVTLRKASPDATDFQIANMPKHATVKSAFTVNDIANSLSRLTVDDVFQPQDLKLSEKPAFTATLETFDGLRITLTALTDKADAKKRYVTLGAAYDASLIKPVKPDSKDKSKNKPAVKTPEQVKQEAQGLEKKFKPWVYALPAFQINNIDKKMSDLISVEKPAAHKKAAAPKK